MQKLAATTIVCSIAALVGGGLTLVAFHGNASEILDYAIVPGTVAYILISGGEAGSTTLAETIAPYVAGIVNMLVYGLLALTAIRIYRRARTH